MPTDLPMRRVAADMERIFRPLADRPPVPRAKPGRPAAPVATRKRPLPWIAGAIVLGVCGAAIGYGRDDRAKDPVVAAGTPAPTPSPTATAAPRSTAAPIAQLALAPPGPGIAEAVPAVQADLSRRPVDSPRPRRAVARHEPAPERDCEPGDTDDQCIYQEVLAADTRLRRAYARAAEAGVDSADLAVIQRRWNRARRDADDDPDGTIRRYDRLAEALEEARR